ncbi:hypothetical protein NC980_24480 [Leptolyngbya sp. AS-A5]
MPRQLFLGFASIRTNAQTLANAQRSHLSIIGFLHSFDIAGETLLNTQTP